MEEKRKYTYIKGIFDVITKEVREKIKMSKEEGKPLGIGVFSDEYCEDTIFTKPSKELEHRLSVAEGFSGVDFVFPIQLGECIDEIAENAYNEYLVRIKAATSKKEEFKAGIVIGNYDLLHAGHIENIKLASEFCERLYAVVKTDERILANKTKIPMQNTTERANNVKLLKSVSGVTYMDLDSTREDIVKDVIEMYKEETGKEISESEIVAVFGEDLKEKEEIHKKEWGDVSLRFTSRPVEKMKKVSSSSYQKKIKEAGGIEVYEARENNSVGSYKDEQEGKGEM